MVTKIKNWILRNKQSIIKSLIIEAIAIPVILIGSRKTGGLLWAIPTFIGALIVMNLALYFFWSKMKWYTKLTLIAGSIGALLNSIVIFANKGYMPVVKDRQYYTLTVEDKLWVLADESHILLALADRYSGFSIGDFFLIAALCWIFFSMTILGTIKLVKLIIRIISRIVRKPILEK